MDDMTRLQCKREPILCNQASPETYRCLLERCMETNSLEEGRSLHAHMVKSDFDADGPTWTCLVNLYIKCGSLEDARKTFTSSGLRNTISWNAIIAAYCQTGSSKKAVDFFWEIEGRGLVPNKVTYLNTLKACSTLRYFHQGSQVYAHMIVSGLPLVEFTANTLIDMYAKCGSLEDSCQIFKTMHGCTVTSWNVMISGLAQHGHFDDVSHAFRQMVLDGFIPDDYTLVIILRVCMDTGALFSGQCLHDYVIRSGIQAGVYVDNTLMAMYAKCGSLEDAHVVFRLMPARDLITWNAMIGGCVQNKEYAKALEVFEALRGQGMKPDRATFINTLKACISLDSLYMGKRIHACFIEDEDSHCILLMTTLVDMYTKCGSTEDARRVFDNLHMRNVVVWNVMIAGYSHSCNEASKLFARMLKDSLEPDEVTFLNLLKACNNSEDVRDCQLIHSCCIESSYEKDLYIGSSLVDVYSTCGRLLEALRVFEVMPQRSIVSWNAIVGGCAEQSHEEDALELFQQMGVEGFYAEDIMYVNVFNACADLADMKQGKSTHCCLIFSGRKPNHFVENALVDMYGKCGDPYKAFRVFNQMSEKDIVSWNALISGYAQHGHSKQAIQLAEKMQGEGVQYNEITLVGVLTACSYAGFISEAIAYLDTMYQGYGVRPIPEHYACMVDVYSRAGLLTEAVQLVKQMPMEPTSSVWMALLGASRIYGSIELATKAAEHIRLMEPENSAAFLLFASLQRSKQA